MKARQRRFVAEYLVDLNPVQAAIRAGYTPVGAKRQALQMLRWPHIAEALKKGMAERILTEYARIALADIGRLADWGPDGMTLKPRSELSPEDTSVIAELSPGTGKSGSGPKLRLHDKRGALDVIARHLGLFEPRPARDEEAVSEEEDKEARLDLLRRLRAMSDEPPAPGG